VSKKVLIVEDNDHLRNILALILQCVGYEILQAENGAEAIEQAVSGQPHLILLDLDLPDITGVVAARKLKQHPQAAHIPIIACSAYSSGQEKEQALRAGVVDYLQKPMPSDLVKAKIEEFILRS
jgi:two-component system, cell cycle response regulator DivK